MCPAKHRLYNIYVKYMRPKNFPVFGYWRVQQLTGLEKAFLCFVSSKS